MNEKRHGSERGETVFLNVTEIFMSASPTELAEELAKLKDVPLSIEIPISQLGSDYFVKLLDAFLKGFSHRAIRKATIVATAREREAFKNRFPGVEWKISG